jgi:dihydropyrimidine dehydrogenase (NAD+) subunit PreA
LAGGRNVDVTTPNLETEFCGVRFLNPFTLSSAPPTTTGEMIMRAFDTGWGAAITKSLTVNAEKTVNVTPRLATINDPRGGKTGQAQGLQNIELATTRPLDVWLQEIREIRGRYPDHVIMASIMSDADSPDDWKMLTVETQNAGAQIIELNLACPHGLPEMGMGAAIGANPELVARVTQWSTDVADVPVIAKLTAICSDIQGVASAAMSSGASGIAAINTVDSISGVDLDTLVPHPTVGTKSTHGGLSGPAIKPIALRCVADIARIGYPVSCSGGLWTWRDAAEFVLLGASNLQFCTLVMYRGYKVIRQLTRGLLRYMEQQDFETIEQFRGASLAHLVSHSELSREDKVVAWSDQEICRQCGRCFTSCHDAGYQAITWEKHQFPVYHSDRCDGCSLCMHVCPEGAIQMLTPEEAAKRRQEAATV